MCDLISVIVPIYNVELYLKKCVDSIRNQSYKILEIILVDDGSPDHCGQMCDEYAKEDDRIKVIHKPNGGLSDARNAGLDIMTGSYVAFVDSDDWIEPNMYERLLQNMKEFRADVSVGGVEDIIEYANGVSKVIKTTSVGDIHNDVTSNTEAMKRYFLGSTAAWDKLYKSHIFKELRFPVGEINEDEAIIIDIFEQCENVVYTNEVFYHYIKRQKVASITSSSFSKRKLDWCNHCKRNLLFIKSIHPDLEKYAQERYVSSLIWALNNMSVSPGEFKDVISYYRKELKDNMKSTYFLSRKRKEKVRALLLIYFFKMYSIAVCLLGKKFS